MRKNNKAFTLVELLAVIVILGILMLITFPKILEMINREQDKMSDAKISMLYTATKRYLFDYNNQYPAREGNTFCIRPKELNDENYLAFEADELDTSYVVKVSYFDEEEYQLSYVKDTDCSSKGVINTELAGLTCMVDKTGYSISKRVTVSYPESDEFIYRYSLDEGKTWKDIKNFDDGNKMFFYFNTSGSVLAKVSFKDSTAGEEVTCSAYVDQIDPTPIGTVIAYAGNDVPAGYLLADGASISRSKYSELYEVISTSYGTPPSNKYFYIPDLTGKLVVGFNNSDSDFTYRMSGGAKTHTLTANELPKHTHTFNGTSNLVTGAGGAHTHTYNGTTSTKTLTGGFHTWGMTTSAVAGIFTTVETDLHYSIPDSGDLTGGATYYIDASHTHTYSGTTVGPNTTHTHTVTSKGTNSSIGSGKEHNNLMPYITLKYIIKYQ